MERNPFEVLGVTPALVRRLTDEQLFELVRSNYRLLLKAFHPDMRVARGEESKKAHREAVELNRAFEKLNLPKDPESFGRFKERYAGRSSRGLRKELSRVQERLNELWETNDGLSARFLEFLFHFVDGKNGHREDTGKSRSAPLFPVANLRIGLQDVAVGHNLRYSAWNLGRNYKEIWFDGQGTMYYRLLARKRFSEVNYIRLLGSIESHKLNPIPYLNRRVGKNHDLWNGRSSSLDYSAHGEEVLNTIDVDAFREYCLPLLTPALKEGAYLFSVHVRPTGSLLENPPREIWLEGKIVKLDEGAETPEGRNRPSVMWGGS